ncbi:hypothetical protein O6H91_11G021700 [Diphasiastrum complanatum]|uniref:Uncharacterized protein n=1 Tax=Diphasiastrum complanatum TaxID=34168 RepID=A0ACC2C6Y1_DIPCM|nr:hypothetical protein O6H91_11G021700 [Diphasiastrum complanatum]
MGCWVDAAWAIVSSGWMVLVASIWIECFGGASYNFSLYSQKIKAALGYNQQTLDTLAFFKVLGTTQGIFSGLLYDYSSPLIVLAVGALHNVIGYLMLWLSVTGRISSPSVWEMCLFVFIAINGQTFFGTATVVTCVKIFPADRGTVIGLLKGFMGVSGAIMTQFYYFLCGSDANSFLLMLSWLPTVCVLSVMWMVKPLKTVEIVKAKEFNFYFLSGLLVFLAAYLLSVLVVESTFILDYSSIASVCIIMLLILVFPFWVVLKSVLFNTVPPPEQCEPLLCDVDQQSEVQGQLWFKEHTVGVADEINNNYLKRLGTSSNKIRMKENPEEFPHRIDFHAGTEDCVSQTQQLAAYSLPSIGNDLTIREALFSADFWLLFMAIACGVGSVSSANDNLGQVGLSLGYSELGISTCNSLTCIFTCLGRLGAGILSDHCLHAFGTPRPAFVVLSMAAVSVGHVLNAIPVPGSLYLSSVVINFFDGMQWSLMFSITSELFGLPSFGTLLNIVSCACPLGAYIISVQITGRLYDMEAQKEANLGIVSFPSDYYPFPLSPQSITDVDFAKTLTCHGSHCFRVAFIAMAGFSLLGAFFAAIIVSNTHNFYKSSRLVSQ